MRKQFVASADLGWKRQGGLAKNIGNKEHLSRLPVAA